MPDRAASLWRELWAGRPMAWILALPALSLTPVLLYSSPFFSLGLVSFQRDGDDPKAAGDQMKFGVVVSPHKG